MSKYYFDGKGRIMRLKEKRTASRIETGFSGLEMLVIGAFIALCLLLGGMVLTSSQGLTSNIQKSLN